MATTETVEKEGYVRKRGGRMHRWTTRYFVLTNTKISYKQKHDSPSFKGTFDFAPGCIVTEVQEESIGTIKGKKIYVFWLVWPHDKNSKHDEKTGASLVPDESDDEAENKEGKDADGATKSHPKVLKDIVEREQSVHRKQQQQVEEQLERHEANDKHASFRYTVAAAAAGGVVVGALTAGIGLVPYLAVVGTVAAVGGGGLVAMRFRRPFDSRLIIACETMHDALAWKTAIEQQILGIDKVILPPSADPRVISNIIGLSVGGGGWRKRSSVEGMRLMEQNMPSLATKCMKAHVLVHTAPFPAFLALMDGKFWPFGGKLKVLETIDDHADIIGVEVSTEYTCPAGLSEVWSGKRGVVTRRFCLSRFWKMDDDGVYLITYNSAQHSAFPCSCSIVTKGCQPKQLNVLKTPVDAVLTVSPRKDHGLYDDDLAEALVSCTCQVSTEGWAPGEMDTFLSNFMTQHLLELKQALQTNRYMSSNNRDGDGENTTSNSTLSERGDDKFGSTSTSTPGSGPVVPSSLGVDTKPRLSKSKSTMSSIGSSFSKRGIATVQPGADDIALNTRFPPPSSPIGNSSKSSMASTGLDAAPGSEGQTASKKRYIFGGALSNPSKKDDKEKVKRPPSSSLSSSPPHSSSMSAASASLDSSPKKDAASARSKSPGPLDKSRSTSPGGESQLVGPSSPKGRVSIGRRRSRSAAVNSEAAGLRDRIACKEYEVARLEKQLNKSMSSHAAATGGTSSADFTCSNGVEHGSFVEFNAGSMLSDQIAELEQMKAEYQLLTGSTYEQPTDSRRRRLINYLRGNNKEKREQLDAVAALLDQSSSSQDISLVNRNRPRAPSASGSGFPTHWSAPTRQLRCDVSVKDLSSFTSSAHATEIAALESLGGSSGGTLDSSSVTYIGKQMRRQSSTNFQVLLLFAFSALATGFLAQILSVWF